MKIGILGYGKEGKSAEKYFKTKTNEIEIIDNFTTEELQQKDFSQFDLILRSPSVHPQSNFSSMTKYFFDHCPCPIIGVTGTKGKGTTCSIITDLLKNLDKNVYLIGNIGNPALDILDQLGTNDIVVYEMSSFQLWDLHKSPHIAVILGIEPDHLNVHDNYTDYINAKANIAKHQSPDDFCIYYRNNPDTIQIAEQSLARKISYPITNDYLDTITAHIAIPGQHNRENAQAALLAVASFYQLPLETFLERYQETIIQTLENFHGLPHRLQYLRELNGVKYYDDNFSTTPTSLKVALGALPDNPIILIAGGRDKTANQDLPEIADLIQNTSAIAHLILIGESGQELYSLLSEKMLENITKAGSLSEAVNLATATAEKIVQSNHLQNPPSNDTTKTPIVLMSPAAASFDMFESVYDRGAQFQKLVQDLQ